MSRYTFKPAVQQAVLAAIPGTTFKKLQDLVPIVQAHVTNARQGLINMCNDGLLFRCRAKIGSAQAECLYFTDMWARNAFHDQYLEATALESHARRAARDVRKKQRLREARAGRVAEALARRIDRKERIAAEKAERARIRLERRAAKEQAAIDAAAARTRRAEERELRAAERRQKDAERKKQARGATSLSKAKKIVAAMPGRKQVANAQGVSGLRERETRMIELRKSNRAKADPIIPPGLKPVKLPANPGLGNRFYVDPASVPRFKYGSGVAA